MSTGKRMSTKIADLPGQDGGVMEDGDSCGGGPGHLTPNTCHARHRYGEADLLLIRPDMSAWLLLQCERHGKCTHRVLQAGFGRVGVRIVGINWPYQPS